jgi:hypothetical protein
MKVKATFLLTFTILLMMIGAGVASAYVGYLMGREALKVVTQPDTDSEQAIIDRKKPLGGSHKGLKIVEERSILVDVYNYTHQKEQSSSTESKQSSIKPIVSKTLNKPDVLIKPEYFPFTDRSGGVTIEIAQATLNGNSVMLDVNLKNEGTQAVRFLYSFLDVRDNQNRALSAIADGLPGELPPNGQNFQGKFIIPVTLLDDSQNISLTLQDYPEQKLTLQLNSIPITR